MKTRPEMLVPRQAWRSGSFALNTRDAEPVARFLDGLPVGVFVVDDLGRPTYANRVALGILGHDMPLEASFDAIVEQCHVHHIPSGTPYPLDELPTRRALRGETCTAEDIELRHRSPPVRLRVTAAPLCGPEGKVQFALATFTPLTAQDVEMEHGRERRAQRLSILGEQAAGIAHEINTPMQYIGDNTAFLGVTVRRLLELAGSFERLLEACKQGAAPDDLTGFERDLRKARVEFLREQAPSAIDQCLAGIDQVRSIVQALKEFSHPGQQSRVEVDINQVVRLSTTITRGTWRHRADLELMLDESLPLVPGYPQDLAQAIINLVVNAAHAVEERHANAASSKGKIEVRTLARDGGVEISVRDDGAGIPESIRHRVMEPFFTTKRAGVGTGQGLPLVHNIVTVRHRGQLTFESEVGAGTTFILWLPRGE